MPAGRRRRALRTALLPALVLAVPVTGAGAPGAIAFVRIGDGGGDVGVVPAAGGPLRVLGHGGGAHDPRWSPDGRLIAYADGDTTTAAIRVVAAAGGPPRTLADPPGADGSPDWSPDGRRVAWVARPGGRPDVWVATLRGGPARRLTRGGDGVLPAWSPDGRRIAYLRAASGDLEVVPAGGGPSRVVGRGLSPGPSAPVWSPAGRLLAAVSAAGRLVVLDAAGGPRRILGPCADPAWAPDGRAIACLVGPRGALVLRPPDGAAPRRLVAATDALSPPAWSPGGAGIAFADRDGRIAVIGRDGRGLRRLTPPATGADPDWRS